jgi:tRNA nucleotidyltransferase (CCA-adding enzyme)
MKSYLVGGALRDQLLGLPVKERDWVVVGATPAEMEQRGFRQVEAEFPVFLHPQSGEEYALARTETKSAPGYAGFEVDCGPGITLQQDLQRRDLTINAMAEDEDGTLIDLFGGRDDLEQRVLRHISPAFAEDPVRLLRLARFAAKLDFAVAAETQALMQDMANSGELQALRSERVWREMERALGEDHPWRFFEVLQDSGALAVLLPELAMAMEQYPETMVALKRAAASSRDSVVRFAVVMSAVATGDDVESFCRKLRAPRDHCELLELLQRGGELFCDAGGGRVESILQLIRQSRAIQQRERFEHFCLAGDALWPDLAPAARRNLELSLQAIAEVSSQELQQEGYSGAELGAELEQRQLAAVRTALQG